MNIGQGGLAGLNEFNRLNQQDRQNALAQGELGIRQGQLGLEARKENFAETQAQRLWDGMKAQADALSGSTNPSAAPTPAIASPQAGGLVPSATPADGNVPVAGGLVPQPISSPPNPTALPGASLPPAVGSSAPTSTPAASGASDFWSNVSPQSNPNYLNAQADRAQAAGTMALRFGNEQSANAMFTMASSLRQRAQDIGTRGTVMTTDGRQVAIPGSIETGAAKDAASAEAKTQGETAGKVQTVYDPDGNPISVPGSTYQQIVANGGGAVNGMPVSASQSPYAAANVDNYKEFSKDAVKFQSDYQQNRYALNALSQIYSKYQGGRGAEAMADLDGLIKQMPGNVSSWLPDKWQNSQSGFDAALKGAVDQAFKNLADSGAQRAPAAGLRESLLTSARPDADPVAVQKILSDKLAALDYSHDLYNSVVNGADHNVNRAIQTFQQGSKYSDYVNASRGSMPTPKGVTPSSSTMVLGSPNGQMPAKEQSSVNRPSVGELMQQARDAIAKGAPKAAVMQRLQSQYNISGAGL